ncbi:hypothetical protein F442_01479 [Phytophthora nicotianae P10297]|uniref:Uncharacterized protein n=1 Tax=Phytophthora nicotianae P10297 TaxID=1317064 RepID=W3A1Y9_PHYNI|nr:hypothetical protein F442_01479 [Phytophthora nicotianae P10297]
MAHRRDSLPVQLALSPKSLPRFGSIPCHDIANTSGGHHMSCSRI